MAMREIASSLKASRRFFQVFDLVFQINSVKTDFGWFFFQNSFDYVFLVVRKQFMQEQRPSIKIYQICDKNKENTLETGPLN